MQEGRKLPETHASVVAEQRPRVHRSVTLLRLPPRRTKGSVGGVLDHPRAWVHLDRAMDRLSAKHQVSTSFIFLR